MWNARRSIQLSLALVDLCAVVALVCALAMPTLAAWHAKSFGRAEATQLSVAFYCCLPFALLALGALHRMLRNLLRELLFIAQNVTLLRVLSWCCFGVALVTLVVGCLYQPFLLICAAAAFMGLILRVIKNVFCSAIELKAENDMTI